MNVIAKQLGQTKWSVHPKTLLRKIWAGEILQETMCITMCIHAFRCHATSPRLCVVIKWSISTCHPYQTSGVFRISCEDMAQLSDCETFTMKTSTGTWARTSVCHLRPGVPVQALLLPCDFGYLELSRTQNSHRFSVQFSVQHKHGLTWQRHSDLLHVCGCSWLVLVVYEIENCCAQDEAFPSTGSDCT